MRNSLSSDQLLEILYEAYNAEIGIAVLTSNPQLLRQRFYTERKKDPDLECISITISPTNPSGELWLLNKRGKQDAG